MANITAKDNEPGDIVLRRFKRACEKDGIISELRRRECFEKPCWRRKRKKAAARKRHLKRLAKEQPMPRSRRRIRDINLKTRPKARGRMGRDARETN